ncbi:peroxiredoxin family protein [Sunxiuqinia sp. A32]|uniref:peroxiredoxin family protein n=1 Tax=Sunxiuqinia sp. A32 TaxID=3461496 RepID=UPI0040466AB9
MNKIIALVLLLVTIQNCHFANAGTNTTDKLPCSVTLVVRNQRSTILSVEQILGDKHIVVDSIEIHAVESQGINSLSKIRTYTFTIPSEKSAGIYRLVLGQTLVAEVLNEPPQSIDIIVNSEDIFIETDFEKPLESINILESNENKLWYSFKKRDRVFERAFQLADKEVDYCLDSKKEINACVQQIEYYNKLQKQHNQFIDSLTTNSGLLADQIIKSFKIPSADGYLAKSQRDSILKRHFFKHIDFSDEMLLNTSVFTDKIYAYLMLYAKSGLTKTDQENQFMQAINNVFESMRTQNSTEPKNSKIYDFIIDYLFRGFEGTNMPEIVNFIGENFSTSNCQSEKKNIVDRKVAYYKMKIGDVTPDFRMVDINDDPIQLSKFLKPMNIIIFWSSECPHCKEILPKLNAWYKSIHANNLEIFAISLDSVRSKWKRMVYELQIESWINMTDLESWDGTTALQYNIFKTPTIFIVDEKQVILSKPQTISEISNLYSIRPK